MDFSRRLRLLFRDTAIYGVGGALAKAVPFLMLPVYTRLLDPAEYGRLELLLLIGAFLGGIIRMGMDTAQTYFFFRARDEGHDAQSEVVSTVLGWHLLWGAIVVLAATALAPAFNQIIFAGELELHHFVLAFVNIFTITVLAQGTELFRLSYRPFDNIGATLTNAVLAAALAFSLMVFLNMGIAGYLLGGATAAAVTAVWVWFRLRGYLGFPQGLRERLPKLLRFGVPFLPAMLATYLLNSIDRWFLSHFHSMGSVGIYAVSAKVALVFSTLVLLAMKGFMPASKDWLTMDDRTLANRLFEITFRYFGGLGALMVIAFAASSPLVVAVIAAPEYSQGVEVVGILVLAAYFWGGTYFSSLGIWRAEKTYLYAVSTMAALVLGVVLDWVLVPGWGRLGAAIGTAAAMLVLTSTSFYLSQGLWRITYSMGVAVVQAAAAVAAVAAQYLHGGGVLDVPAAFGVMLAAAAVVIAVTVRDMEEIFLIFNRLGGRNSRRAREG